MEVAGLSAGLCDPTAVTLASNGDLYIADNDDYAIKKLSAGDSLVHLIGGTGNQASGAIDTSHLATAVDIGYQAGLYLDESRGLLYSALIGQNAIYSIDINTGAIAVFVGGGDFTPHNSPYSDDTNAFDSGTMNGLDAANSSVRIAEPAGITMDSSGNIFFATVQGIMKVDTNHHIFQVAGTNTTGTTEGVDGDALTTQLNHPSGLIADASGNIYFTEYTNCTVRKLDTTASKVTRVAGQIGLCDYAGVDGTPATSAKLSYPEALLIDLQGNLIIFDSGNNVIRKVDSNGNIFLLAGTPQTSGNNAEMGVDALTALFYEFSAMRNDF